MKALACMFTQACAKLYKKTSYNLRLSQRPLRSARQRASMDRVVTISVNRNHEAVMVKELIPPTGGVDSDGMREAAQGQGQTSKIPSQKIQHAPSFIGEDATIRLIGLSHRSSWAILAVLRGMQKPLSLCR